MQKQCWQGTGSDRRTSPCKVEEHLTGVEASSHGMGWEKCKWASACNSLIQDFSILSWCRSEVHSVETVLWTLNSDFFPQAGDMWYTALERPGRQSLSCHQACHQGQQPCSMACCTAIPECLARVAVLSTNDAFNSQQAYMELIPCKSRSICT